MPGNLLLGFLNVYKFGLCTTIKASPLELVTSHPPTHPPSSARIATNYTVRRKQKLTSYVR
jgi:hypothetical protein